MSTNPAAQKRTAPSSSPVRSRIAALRQAYVAHTLKRAIADVASTSERDYRDFGLEKGELLDGLTRLMDLVRATPDAGIATETGERQGSAYTRAFAGHGRRLAVTVVKHLGGRRHGRAAPRQVAPA